MTGLFVFFIAACDNEDTIVVFDEQEYPPPVNSECDISSATIPQTFSLSYPIGIKRELGNKIIGKYPIEGSGDVTLRHSIYKFYAFEGNENPGDYYIMQTEVTVESEGMYKGLSRYDYKDNYNESTTHICGYYLLNMRLRYELVDSEGNTVGTFPFGESPKPLTTIGSTTYTYGRSWKVGGKFRIGVRPDTTGIVDYMPLVFNIAYNNSAKRNKKDMDVINNSTQNIVDYEFRINKLPAENAHKEGVFEPELPPTGLSIADNQQTQDFIWYIADTKDGQGNDVKFKMKQKIELDYGVCFSVSSFVGKGPIDPLSEEIITLTHESEFDITPPNRTPMGKLKITNKNKKMFIKDVSFTRIGAAKPSARSRGSISFDKSYESYLDAGTYKVQFLMGHNSKDIKTYTLCDDSVRVNKNDDIELFSDFDFYSE